jgi:isoleucyl-tRNA synthetase
MSEDKVKQARAKSATGQSAGAGDGDGGRDWSATLFLPKTDFPMRAGLPKREPEFLAHWDKIDLYGKLRAQSEGRDKFVLHDGPPYANAHIHIGTGLNKILKDIVVKSQQMLGFDSNYVPGWDCHGLPIEWEIEKKFASQGRQKGEVPADEFRKECRQFAEHWLDVQREEFKRLGVVGDWENPYTTMAYRAEATIADELMKFAMNGLLYRGSKPVMWSVVEQTALAEAEVEYHNYQSDTVWVKFPVLAVARKGAAMSDLLDAFVVIWTTTPWTIPGNRAISFSSKLQYGLYEVTEAENDFGPQKGEQLILAAALADDAFEKAKLKHRLIRSVTDEDLAGLTCAHPLRGHGYEFDVPLLDGDHVTDEAGTGFVHTAPGHGREDFEIWMEHGRELDERGIDTRIPFTVGPDGRFTDEAPGFAGEHVITEKGDKGKANQKVIEALISQDMLFARGRLKHQYPHSWRSKKPVIFRNTPQWFVYMDRDIAGTGTAADGSTLRELAMKAISETEFVPRVGQNRLRGMVEAKPDWVLSRQRNWGVPITVFVHNDTGEVIPSATFNKSSELIRRITHAMHEGGADAWFADGAKAKFLEGLVDNPDDWEQVTDILDVWFDSGSTHVFTLEDPQAFPGLAGINRKVDGGADTVMYLEGSDQHRGWFQSSLLESCATRGRAPYDIVLTHGFVLDEKGMKMSKSLGNTTAPQDVIKQFGADILRLWVAASDYSDDLRIGPEILKTFVETYRKLRNSVRWMLGALAHHDPAKDVAVSDMPLLERFMLHRLAELDGEIRAAYAAYEYRRVVSALSNFMNSDLSAFYFDVRKDALYCEPASSQKRLAALTVISKIFDCVTVWLAPVLSFTAEEAWLDRHPTDGGSVHLEVFPVVPAEWRDDALAARFDKVMRVRRVVTGALEVERREKRIGSSLEAAPEIYVADDDLKAAFDGLDVAEIMITSAATLTAGSAPGGAFTIPEVSGVGVVTALAEGTKCARSWRIVSDVGADSDYPELSERDARAVREFDQTAAH